MSKARKFADKFLGRGSKPAFEIPDLKTSYKSGVFEQPFTKGIQSKVPSGGNKSWGGKKLKALGTRVLEDYYTPYDIEEAKTELEYEPNESYLESTSDIWSHDDDDDDDDDDDMTINFPTEELKKMSKQISLAVSDQQHDSGINKRTKSTANKRPTKFIQSTEPPKLNVPYKLELNEDIPVRGLAFVVSLHWSTPDIEGEVKPLKVALRSLKYEVVGTYGAEKQVLLDMKKEWIRQMQSMKYPSFVCIIIGSSDTEQNFVTTDNKMVSRDEILFGLDAGFPHQLPKLFFFNSLLPQTATDITQELPKNTFYMHTYVDMRIHGPKTIVCHPFLETFYEVVRSRGSKDEFQEMVRRAKHKCLAAAVNYSTLHIRQHSTLQRPLFLTPEHLNEETNLLGYFSLNQAYPIQANKGLVLIGLIEDVSWTQTAKYQKATRSIFNNLKTTLQFYNLNVITFELSQKFEYKNDLLKALRRHRKSDIIVLILLGTCPNENHFRFHKGKEILLLGEVMEDMNVIAPDVPKLLFISQLLHLDPRGGVRTLLDNNQMQSEEKAPFIHNSYVIHAKNKVTLSLEGTFLSTLTDALKSKFRKLEFTKLITHMRLNSSERNLLPNFLEMNNLESPLYLLPEELKISAELLSRGEEFASLYQEALDDGLELLRFYRLMVVGPEGVGKTSLLRALTGKPFEENQTSTPFIDKFDVQIHKISKDWKQNEDLDTYADRLLDTKEQMAVNYVVGKLKENTRKSSTTFESDTVH